MDVKPLWKRTATAPGKAILFGEHAVVFGFPAVSLAVDLPTTVTTQAYDREPCTLEGSAEAFQRIPYLRETVRCCGGRGLDVHVRSALPRASGLGSSAAVTCGLAAALLSQGSSPLDRAALAKRSFEAEFSAQGVGSPVDTSTLCAGGIVSVGGKGYGKSLWEIPATGGKGPWKVDRLPDPGWDWVVAYTGSPKATGKVVSAVGKTVATSGTAVVEKIAAITEKGIAALFKGDREEVGRLMKENHHWLGELGVSNPRLEEVAEAVREVALGVKITGAGLGGSLLALARPGEEKHVARAFARQGTVPFIVKISESGVRLEPN